MFKLESYLTPYISAYLEKYVKDFSTHDFQVSFWQGDAVFHNVNLNLEALENELRLPPLTLVSGHIHELRLNVPWTKITSEPIRVYVNTFEIVLKLNGQQASPKCSSTSLTSIQEKMKSPPEEEGYMKNLVKKVLQNVEIEFENVVLKYVEDDIVLSLNIRKVLSQCVDSKWESAFVELNPPTYILRKLWTCSDLTVCLDRTNNVGKIEQYMDPILYRCSFEVRVLYQYHGLNSQIPFFGRYDVKIKSMNFSIITEQLAILARLYHLVKLLTYMDPVKRSTPKAPSATTSEQGLYDESKEDDDSMLGWAAWAVSWVPAIPEVIFGPSDESMEPIRECEFAAPVVHYGIFVENAVIDLKLFEKTSDKFYRKTVRLKYTPFLKCEMQGIAMDLIFRGLDANFKMGISEVVVNRSGYCPCGIDDSSFQGIASVELSPFLRIGVPNPDYASESMFNLKFELMGDIRPPVDYHFKLEGHLEEYTEEQMLKRTPGIALEFLELEPTPVRLNEDEDANSNVSPVTPHCSLCRLVTGTTHVKVCSGSIHRARLIYNYIAQVDKSQYDFLQDIVFPKTEVFNEAMNTLDGRTLATFRFSIRDPLIEVMAGDHPDYDEHSHIRAVHQRRKCTNMKPLTLCTKQWPKFIMRCREICGHYTEPTVKFIRLVECYSGSFVDHPDVVSDYAAKLKVSVDNLTTRLICGVVDASLIEPCAFSFKYEDHFKQSMQSSDLEPVKLFEVHIDSLLFKISKPNLMACHVILRSTYEESMALALIYTTLMDDLPPFKNCDFIFGLMDANFIFSRTNTITSYRASLKSATFSATMPEFAQPVQLLEVPTATDAPHNFIELFLQYPTKWDENDTDESHKTSLLRTPACAIYIGTCRVNLYLPVIKWLTYAPEASPEDPSLPPSVPEIVKTCKRLLPISPLGKNPHQFMASTTSGADDQDSRSSSMGSQSLTGVRELYKQHPPTHKTDMSSNLSYKSAPEENFNELMSDSQSPWPPGLEARQAHHHHHTNTSSWERWIVTHLAMLKRTLLKIEIEGVKLCFPVECTKTSTRNLPDQEYLVIEMPLLIAQPEALNAILFERSFFRSTKPIEIKDQALYPLKIVLTDVHGYSLHGSSQQLTFLPNVTARLTLTLSDKLAENKYPTIFACIHCDIPPVKIVLSTLQVKLLMQIMETVVQTAHVVKKISESSFLLTIDPSWENMENNEPTRLASSEVLQRTRIPGAWLHGEHGSQSSASVFESIPHSVETEESLRKSDTPTQRPEKFKKKATFWAQVTLSHFQLILRNGETPLASDVTNQLVLEIEDVVSALDLQPVYIKLSLKVGTLALRCYERNEKGTWDFGRHNGVVISSGDDITHDIEILGALETEEDSHEESNTVNQVSSSSGAKKHGFLNMTFTRVLARNYHRKSEVKSPTAKWNALLKKYFNVCCEEREDRRTLDEIDIKIRPIDFMFCPDMLLPFRSMLHSVLYTHRNEAELFMKALDGNEQKIPPWNNNTLPLLYLETEMIRVFMQCNKNEDTSTRSHDIALFQVASISLFPQTENPLTRTPVKRDLYTLAEKASILCIPGSPVEDRQYQLDVRDLSIVTCNSGDLEKSSLKEFAHRSSVFLRAMGENPAFEWNIKQEQVQAIEEVEAHIILERMEVSAVFAPPIVYQASRKSVFGSTLITGQVFEMNIPSIISIGCSTEQLGCLISVANDYNDFLLALQLAGNTCKISHSDDTVNFSNCASTSSVDVRALESDTSLHTLLTPKPLRATSRTELDSGIASSRRTEYFSNRESTPSDVIVTCSSIEIKLYEIQRKESLDVAKHPRHYIIKPLFYLSFAQPHLIGHASSLKQNLEITTYGLSIGLGIKNSYTSESLSIPQAANYSLKVVRSIEGKKNPKTGMANAFLTLRLTDFFYSTCKASLLLFRPIHLVVTHDVMSSFQRLASSVPTPTKYQPNKADDSVAATEHIFSQLSAFTINSDQVVLTVKAAPSGLAVAELVFAVTDMNLTLSSKTKKAFGHFPFFANVEGSGNGIVVCSKLQERTDIILNPWNLKLESSFQVCSWSAILKGNVLVRAEPVSMFFGPQNMLAALQVYHEFEHFLQAGEEITSGEKLNDTVIHPSQAFYDDLRAGIFKYVVSDSAAPPGVYQISFSHSQQTMTWRYPQPRFLSEVVVLPAPIVSASSRTQEYSSVECSLMYWVETLSEFKELAVFTLSETSGMKIELPTMQSPHDCVSDIWRVGIITYHDEDESEREGIRPEILANCLQVNSVYNPTLLQELNVSIDLPRVTLHLMNHLALAGQMPENKLSRFSYSTPMYQEQEFATVELSSSYINLNQWMDRADFSVTSYFQCSVAEYSFLTDYSLIEPFHFQFKAGWSNECLSDVDFLAKPIVLKLGGSSLHTLVSSFVLWKQLLLSYNGKQVYLSETTSETNIILSRTVMCNDTASPFNILQDGTDTYFSLLMRQCHDFHWTSPKAAPKCRIRLQGESCWSKPFELNNDGYIVRDAGNNLPVFVNISPLSPSQKMVTISGGLIVANALNESIDVSIVFTPFRNGNEMSYSIAGRSHGPSQILDIKDIHCLQFKLSAVNEKNSGWSMGMTLEDLRKSANRAVAVKLLSPESKRSSPANFNVWCALVEEKIENFSRHLVIICPFFRVKSSLAVPTLTHVTTGKNEIENSSLLQGKGSEIQVDFVGPPDSTLHLTFQHGEVARDSRSRPTIPLNPQGPALEKKFQPVPIDEILEHILLRTDPDKPWPFIREDTSLTAWEQTEPQPDTEVQVEFSPWIQGLPSVLIDAKPWALFVNLTGMTIIFSQSTSAGGRFKIPHTFVFTPSKIKEFFRLGIDYRGNSHWSPNMEFTEQKSRTDIHYVNSDSRIPIDSYSRLEIFGKEETWYITLETRIHKGILVLTLRPTFSIQNRTEIAMNIKCLSLMRRKDASENELGLKHDCIKLDVDTVGARSNVTTEPLILFHKISDGPKDEPRVKYLAISHEQGPFWFVPLANFELIFNNMSASEVIPGHRIALALQSCQPFRTRGSGGKLVRATHPVVLSWVCKYGQVWISISTDLAPPIVLINETNGHFAVSESSGRRDLPYQDNDHFAQYLTLSPFSIGHCSLPSINAKFPDLSKSEPDVSVLLGRHRDMLPGGMQTTSVYYESSQLEWSGEICLNKISGTHSFRIGDHTRAEHYQLRVERLGLSYFVYIRNMPATEISAKDIRGRIAEASSSSQALLDVRREGGTKLPTVLQSDNFLAELQVNTGKSDIESCPPACPFPLVRIYAPSVRLIVMDEYTYFKERREMLGITFQDLLVDITPETDPNMLEILQNKFQENIVINVRLGDFQIDNALYEEKKFDFPVILKRVDDYKPSAMKTAVSLEAFDALFLSASQEKAFLVQFTGLIGLYSPTRRSLQKVWVEAKPIAVYIEDAFYYFLQPAFHDILNIVHDRLELVKPRPSSTESFDVDIPWKETTTAVMMTRTPPPTGVTSLGASSYECLTEPAVTAAVLSVVLAEEFPETNQSGDQHSKSIAGMSRLQVPSEILSIINEFGDPIRMQQIWISPTAVFVTIRLSRRVYLAVDHSPLEFSVFEARSILTTNLVLGHALSSQYVQGALFGSTNPVKLLGSLELLGSPGSLARSFTIGIKDFVVYPVKGLFEGPAGFLTGFTHGFSSLVTNVGSGTLTSMRNLAWSVSRNLDRMTLSENEQLQHEEDRRAPIDGVSDGIIQGLTGFGIRLLGAIGGLAQHPIDSVIDSGASPIGLLAGFGRGLLGVITKPIGGAVELVAMTGQGILTGAGWTPRLQRKHNRINENVDSSGNSMLKYYWLLLNETPDEEHKILLLFDASLCTTVSETTRVSIVLTSENIYIVNTAIEEIESKLQVSRIKVEPTSDSTKLSLRRAPEKKSETISLAQERLIDFVKECAVDGASSTTEPSLLTVQEHHSIAAGKPDQSFSLDLYVDPNSKSEFITLLKQLQEEKSGTIFRLL